MQNIDPALKPTKNDLLNLPKSKIAWHHTMTKYVYSLPAITKSLHCTDMCNPTDTIASKNN